MLGASRTARRFAFSLMLHLSDADHVALEAAIDRGRGPVMEPRHALVLSA